MQAKHVMIAAVLVLILVYGLGLSGCGSRLSSTDQVSPTPDATQIQAEAARNRVADSLGPYPTYRPAQGNCYTIMTRPFVVSMPASPPGDAVRDRATARSVDGGDWLVEWNGGQWRVDASSGTVEATNAKAISLADESRLPCPDEP